MMTKWFDTLLDYTFEIVHLPGLQNVLPDRLSRLFPTTKELGEVEVDQEIQTEATANNEKTKVMRTTHKNDLDNDYMEPPTEAERSDILLKAHLFGHFGAEAIVKAIHNNGMHWTNLKKDALELVKKCTPCQRFNIVKTGYNPHKPIHAFLPGDHWAIDLTGPLPTTPEHNTYLLVMVDICSRFVILRPIKDKTAESVVKAIIPVFCDFGIPMIVQSDNGKEFVNQVMTRFKIKAGFDHRLITPYYPQSNGSAERTVGTSKMVIKKLVEGAPEHWDICAPIAQLAINNKVSKRIGATPFSVMFGRKMNDFKNYNEEVNKQTPLSPDEIKNRIAELQNVLFPAIAEKTLQTIKKQKIAFDKTHKQVDFPVGSYVMEKIHPNFRTKMDPRHEGPYEVVRKRQNGSYVLKNTLGELMEKNYTASQLVATDGSQTDEANTYEVETILAHKQDKRTNKYSYKVKWKNFNHAQCTWEPSDNFLSDLCIREYWSRIKQVPNKGLRKNKLSADHNTNNNKRSRQQ
ncbi:hypothetical protein [Absidia glauca]|uniref:Integrase catalytic domain-containing protein n=2 Tax=Absidia glauca TaxID=4829 RepID=A0A163J2W8_ABSGL|nr:hypothetical protein [Absidia glauca]